MKPKIYSYIRFSTDEQALGDSERRQLDNAKRWADSKGLELDKTLTLIDRGVSGFKGAHRTKGCLGRFLDAVKCSKVPSGSILLIENPDRLSREGFCATLRNIIFQLWDHGITLQTLSPEATYKPGCDNDPSFIALMIYLQRAQDESQRKSERIRTARNQARRDAQENKQVLTGRVPAWLIPTYESKGSKKRVVKLSVIPDAVATIRRIFQFKLEGLGLGTITRKLNGNAREWQPPVSEKQAKRRLALKGAIGGGWRESYVKRILTSPATIGIYQPYAKTSEGKREPAGDPVSGYFPAIIKPETFYKVRALMRANKSKGGRIGKCRNLFTHVVRCGYCGGTMMFYSKRGGARLYCDIGRRGVLGDDGKSKCQGYSIIYQEVESVILANCPKLRPDQVLPDPDKHEKDCQSLRTALAGKRSELANIGEQIENFTDQIGRTNDEAMRDRYEAKVRTLTDRKAVGDAECQKAEQELAKAEEGRQSLDAWQRNLDTLRRALKKSDVELRMRLQSHLRELIERIEVFSVGHRHVYDSSQPVPERKPGEDPDSYHLRCRRQEGETLSQGLHSNIMDVAPKLANDKTFLAFLEELTERRMSKEGRFLRVHFKTGAVVNLVPPGSLASGIELVRDKRRADPWRFVLPDCQKLWEEFRARHVANGQKRS